MDSTVGVEMKGDGTQQIVLYLDSSLFTLWCSIGDAEFLKSHSDIASFLVSRYQKTKEEAAGRCAVCGYKLMWLCFPCLAHQQQPQHHQNQQQPLQSSQLHDGHQNVQQELCCQVRVDQDHYKQHPTCLQQQQGHTRQHDGSGTGKSDAALPDDNNSTFEDIQVKFEINSDNDCKETTSLVQMQQQQNKEPAAGTTEQNNFYRHSRKTVLKAVLGSPVHIKYLLNGKQAKNGRLAQIKSKCALIRQTNLKCFTDLKQKHTVSDSSASCNEINGESEHLSLKQSSCQKDGLGNSVSGSAWKTQPNSKARRTSFKKATFGNLFSRNKAGEPKPELKKRGRKKQYKGPHICDECGKVLGKANSLKRHKLSHLDDKGHSCSVCHKSFITPWHVERHMLKHTGEKPHLCELCGKGFSSVPALKEHCLIHAGQRPHICTVCSKAFTASSNLKRHMLVHTGVKSYTCDLCNKSFSHIGSLKRHKLYHSGERRYKCEVCAKAFTTSTDLKHHIKIHLDHKPYECSVCGRGFADGGNYRKHQLTHKVRKNAVCDICSEKFQSAALLQKHKAMHSAGDRQET